MENSGDLRYGILKTEGTDVCLDCKVKWSVIPPDPEPNVFSRFKGPLGAADISDGQEAKQVPLSARIYACVQSLFTAQRRPAYVF